MNTITMESLLITEDEWIATEGVGSAIKKGASAIWTAIKNACRALIETIQKLIGKIRNLMGGLKGKKEVGYHTVPNSVPNSAQGSPKNPSVKGLPAPNNNDTNNNSRWRNTKREDFVKPNSNSKTKSKRYVGGVEIKLHAQTQKPQEPKGPTLRLTGPTSTQNDNGKHLRVITKSIIGLKNESRQLWNHASANMSAIGMSFNGEEYNAETASESSRQILKEIGELNEKYPRIQKLLETKQYVTVAKTTFDLTSILKNEMITLAELQKNCGSMLQKATKLESQPSAPRSLSPVFNGLLGLFAKVTVYIRWQIGELGLSA